MAVWVDEITPALRDYLERQRVFFVATAPTANAHRVSLSPKCGGFACIGNRTVAYCDLTGSGNETAAHLLQNGRITLMFLNIEEGSPNITRIYGTGKVVLEREASPELLSYFSEEVRLIIIVWCSFIGYN